MLARPEASTSFGTGCIREALGSFAGHVLRPCEKNESERDKKQDVAVDAANACTGRPRRNRRRDNYKYVPESAFRSGAPRVPEIMRSASRA